MNVDRLRAPVRTPSTERLCAPWLPRTTYPGHARREPGQVHLAHVSWLSDLVLRPGCRTIGRSTSGIPCCSLVHNPSPQFPPARSPMRPRGRGYATVRTSTRVSPLRRAAESVGRRPRRRARAPSRAAHRSSVTELNNLSVKPVRPPRRGRDRRRTRGVAELERALSGGITRANRYAALLRQ